MQIRDVLVNVLSSYHQAKSQPFRGNQFADKLRHEYVRPFQTLLAHYEARYDVVGSAGKGNWADCPWIAILDTIKTTTPQSGYYLVYLFDKEMNGVYLSLNQGVTAIKEEYRREAREVLLMKAEDLRSKLEYKQTDKQTLKLHSLLPNPLLYEYGNILSVYYSATNIPDEETLQQDLRRFLRYYQELIALDTADLLDTNESVQELKKRRLHEKFDRCGSLSLKVKKAKGYRCEACGMQFTDRYGALGEHFIEVHHLVPFASLDEGSTRLSLQDFAVLCSNCHSMIHRLPDCSDLEQLKNIIRQNSK